jgi:hypothetical protein
MNGQDLHQTDESDGDEASKPNSEVSPRQPKRVCESSNNDRYQPHNHSSSTCVDVPRGLLMECILE